MLALIFRWAEFVSKTKHCKEKYFKTWQRWHRVLCSDRLWKTRCSISERFWGSHWTSLDGTKYTNYTHAISFTDFPSPRSKQSVSFCWQSTNWAPMPDFYKSLPCYLISDAPFGVPYVKPPTMKGIRRPNDDTWCTPPLFPSHHQKGLIEDRLPVFLIYMLSYE